MKIVEKICKEWNSICRVFNIKENPLTYSHKDLLEFAEYYHKSQLNNDVALDIVSNRYVIQWVGATLDKRGVFSMNSTSVIEVIKSFLKEHYNCQLLSIDEYDC